MKLISLIALLLLSLNTLANDKAPAVWGKILKTKSKTYGHEYFVYFKKEGQDYAYPLSTKSNLGKKQLNRLVGKYARIYGETKFERINLEKAKHIITFEVQSAQELTLKDLNQNLDLYDSRIIVQHKKRKQTEEAEVQGVDDKLTNTAIFVGGAALALEVLKNLLSQ